MGMPKQDNSKSNLICIPYAYEEGKKSGGTTLNPRDFTIRLNIKHHGYNIKDIYLMNACVALVSAKWNNPADDVVLATNLSASDIPSEYMNVLKREKIKIWKIPYDDFSFDNEYNWSLAFYKLCVLKHVSEMKYSNICILDSDVYIQGGFEPIWRECEKNILLYDTSHGFNVEANYLFEKEIESFTGTLNTFPTYYGGEFFAASVYNAKKFIEECECIYKEICVRHFRTLYGDEFIIDIAAMKFKYNIINGARYIFRFWTRPSYRLVSTIYKLEQDKLLILHLPSEKSAGFIKAFEKYIKIGKKLTPKKAWKLFRLDNLSLFERIKILVANFLKK